MWSCTKNMVIQLMLCCLVIIVPCSAAELPEYIYHICRNSTTDSSNSLFQANRLVLLSTLASNSARNQGYYKYNYSADSQNSGISPSKLQVTLPSTSYGFSLCQGDLSAKDCKKCVTAAAKDIETKCPTENIGVIWYAECMVRYDSKSFLSSFSQEDEELEIHMWNDQNVPNVAQFQRALASVMNKIITRVSEGIPLNNQTIKRFALGTANLSSLQRLYVSGQCIPDLPEAACNRCLRLAVSHLQHHNNSQGGRSLISSCTFRYEMYPFYRNIAIEPFPSQVTNHLPPPPAAAPSSLPRPTGNGGITLKQIVAIVAPVCVSLVIFLVYCNVIRKAKIKGATPQEESGDDEISTIESLQFELEKIKAATNDFSPDNKIGAGGFGDVFKGVLANGKQIAVKRLSKSSCQGSREFQNEVVLVAKLQHKNLVRVLGFCSEEDEKILVYEYIPNQSLDNILFDPERQRQLDWASRYKIIVGIARGLVYLHEDSRLRIIHRDLKASNILLDENLNAKVSDFGMARILGGEQTHGSTSRVVGTFGYMSPEYVMHGQFSSKSDVFSFGVLVLEIISGKKNSSFYQTDCGADLLSYAWKQWKNGTPLEVMDPSLMDSYSREEVLRCIQIGLLCVQEDVDARSSVAWVLTMLNSQSVSIELPKRPPFFCSSKSESQALEGLISDQSASNLNTLSVDDSSITEVYAR